jgi:RimJ/RimL family protein N-acetyltransferase
MEFRSKSIYFRYVETSDAAFINSLRADEQYNKYLSHVDDDISKQEQWIRQYKTREAAGEEFYFIIHRFDDVPIGTVRVYDFIGDKDSFSWGSWILNTNKTRYAALESAVLIYDFAFDELKFKRCHMNIRKGNSKVIDFHKNFGVKIVAETEEDFIGHFFAEDYKQTRPGIKKIIDEAPIASSQITL